MITISKVIETEIDGYDLTIGDFYREYYDIPVSQFIYYVFEQMMIHHDNYCIELKQFVDDCYDNIESIRDWGKGTVYILIPYLLRYFNVTFIEDATKILITPQAFKQDELEWVENTEPHYYLEDTNLTERKFRGKILSRK